MQTNLELIGALIVLAGSIFLLLAALGLLRMPDFYTRIQAGTKASTLGTILTFIGLAFLIPDWIGKLLVLILFILITNPISSHVLARAAHYIKVPLAKISFIDKLADAQHEEALNKPLEKTEENDH
jgi:multicomponent Na+:H+ antiporter subunit G